MTEVALLPTAATTNSLAGYNVPAVTTAVLQLLLLSLQQPVRPTAPLLVLSSQCRQLNKLHIYSTHTELRDTGLLMHQLQQQAAS